MQVEVDRVRQTATLVIEKLRVGDAAKYSVSVGNEFGKNSVSFYVTIEGL